MWAVPPLHGSAIGDLYLPITFSPGAKFSNSKWSLSHHLVSKLMNAIICRSELVRVLELR